MSKPRVITFKYRMIGNGKFGKNYEAHFYGFEQPEADRLAARWARKQGYKRVVRLKAKL